MSIAELETVVPPPVSVPAVDPVAWAKFEEHLGTALPNDYKAFISKYGFGLLGDFLSVLTPFSENPNANLAVQIERQLAALREMRRLGDVSPYPFFPEPGGLMPFAVTDNGDVLHWLTEGQPDEWRVVVTESRGSDHEMHETNMTDFLASVLSRSRRCAIFPDGLTRQFRSFSTSIV